MTLTSLSDARQELASLRDWVAALSADAVASLDEVGEELFTLHALGLTDELCKGLASTNLLESLFVVVWEKTQRVKN